jgi:hypothetical protein
LAATRAEGRRRGGISRSKAARVLPAETTDAPLRTAVEIVAALEATFNQVRKGLIDAKIGNCLAIVAGVSLRAIQGIDLEKLNDRLEELEARVGKVR